MSSQAQACANTFIGISTDMYMEIHRSFNISVLMVIHTSWYSSILYSSVHGCIWSCLPKYRHVLILPLRSAYTYTWKYTDHPNIIVLMVIPNYLFGSVLFSSVHDWSCLLKHRHVLIRSLSQHIHIHGNTQIILTFVFSWWYLTSCLLQFCTILFMVLYDHVFPSTGMY